MLFYCKIHETIERLFLVPVVKPEAELVHEPLHVFDRYVVEDAVHSALQYRPKALYAIGM